MKKLLFTLICGVAAMAWQPSARAIPVTCIACGSTNMGGAMLSYAVISGADFLNEVAFHNIGFSGTVPGGSLDAIPNATAPTDFVYLYQLSNLGLPLQTYSVIGSYVNSANLTGGGRLESTLFVDPGVGLVSPGPAGATTSLSGGPMVDFINGLNGNWGACLGSGASGVNCSDATANLFPGSVRVDNFAEAPLAPLLDTMWTSSIMWFSSALGPDIGHALAVDVSNSPFSGLTQVPSIVSEPGTLTLFLAAGFAATAVRRRRHQK